jgi:hypothetical protein
VSNSNTVLGQSSNLREDRRKLATSGDLKVAVVRVTCGDKVVTNSLATIEEKVFSDPACLKSQLETCSDGAVRVGRGPSDRLMDVQSPVAQTKLLPAKRLQRQLS